MQLYYMYYVVLLDLLHLLPACLSWPLLLQSSGRTHLVMIGEWFASCANPTRAQAEIRSRVLNESHERRKSQIRWACCSIKEEIDALLYVLTEEGMLYD